jgi:hypothetical protein
MGSLGRGASPKPLRGPCGTSLTRPEASRHRGPCHMCATRHGVRRSARIAHGHSHNDDLVFRFRRSAVRRGDRTSKLVMRFQLPSPALRSCLASPERRLPRLVVRCPESRLGWLCTAEAGCCPPLPRSAGLTNVCAVDGQQRERQSLAAPWSYGNGSKVASACCRTATRPARSTGSSVACGPKDNSPSVTAVINIVSGSSDGSNSLSAAMMLVSTTPES